MDRELLQARLRALFVDELAENVVVLNQGLLALERQDPSLDYDVVVNEIFRAAHSVKGAAQAAGVPELAQMCHQLEDALSRLRDRTLPSSTEVIEPLLEAVDALDRAGRRLRDGEEVASADLGRAGRTLMTLADGPPAGAPPTTVVESAAGHDVAVTPAPRRDGNVRVPAERLDALLDEVGELLHACQRVDSLSAELVALANSAAGRASAVASDDARAWRTMSEKIDALGRGALDTSRALTVLGRGVADNVRRARMVPLAYAYDSLERVVRDLASAGGKDVRLDLHGGQLEVDRPILEAVGDAVLHLVRNAVDHGIESPGERRAAGKAASGSVTVESNLVREGISVTVADDGRGVDLDALRAVATRRGIAIPDDESMVAETAFLAGVSTAPFITEASGRGVGLDAVRARVESVGGSVQLRSAPGAGCSVTLTMPLALSAVRVLHVVAAGEPLALPSSTVSRVVRIAAADIRPVSGRETVFVDGRPVAVLLVADLLGLGSLRAPSPSSLTGVLTGTAPHEALLVVDELLGEEEAVMKAVGEGPAAVPGVLGATILPSGRVALILNPATLVRAGVARAATAPARIEGEIDDRHLDRKRRARVLLAEDTITTRALERSILEAAGYEVLVAVDGLEAWELLDEHGADIVVSDVDMPRMDGVAFCTAVRRSERFGDLPFVLVTSLASEADRRRGVEAGANAYLVKADFDQAILLEALERLL